MWKDWTGMVLAAAVGVGLTGCHGGPGASVAKVPEVISAKARLASEPPPAPREFRAAWVATVQNIDWPSKTGLDAATQKLEIDAILDKSVELKLNALVVQVRTTADALYRSDLEPWSEYLTGEQGKDPGYDPFDYWIKEGHARGIEIHAWFNPYRAKHPGSKSKLAPSHVGVRRPDLVKSYAGYLWLDPGEPDAEQLSYDVFMDVVKRYDVDGIHIDDYFYPYPDSKNSPFPDDPSWQKYLASRPRSGTPTSQARADWRRANINHFIERIYKGKQQLKPWVKFGISPFGIGRPGTAPGIKGFDQYEKLYADAALWLRNGWCDYFTPQLYWPIAKQEQSYPVLLDYWISENAKKRHVWPGLFTSRANERGATRYTVEEIPNQIAVTRERAGSSGHVHFSFKVLQANEALDAMLQKQTYADEALVPASPWLDGRPPARPGVRFDRSSRTLTFAPATGGEPIRAFAVWQKDKSRGWQFRVESVSQSTLQVAPEVEAVVVTAVDRAGNESPRVRVATK